MWQYTLARLVFAGAGPIAETKYRGGSAPDILDKSGWGDDLSGAVAAIAPYTGAKAALPFVVNVWRQAFPLLTQGAVWIGIEHLAAALTPERDGHRTLSELDVHRVVCSLVAETTDAFRCQVAELSVDPRAADGPVSTGQQRLISK